MTSLRQIEANRRNALKSTGPKTEAGKQQSRCNAVRHGLTAETVVGMLEDQDDYKAFELAVTADFDAQTAVERELVLRLASLLWRLRRATAIDTGLLEIPSEIDKASDPEIADPPSQRIVDRIVQIGSLGAHLRSDGTSDCSGRSDDPYAHEPKDHAKEESTVQPGAALNSDIARRFLRLDSGSFERLRRYETALWRQVYQVIFVLEVLRRQNLDVKWRPRPWSHGENLRSPPAIFPRT